MISAVGIVATIYASLRLFSASRIVGDQTLILEGIALLMYAIALGVEVTGLLGAVSAVGIGGGHPPWARHLPGMGQSQLEVGKILQASLLAGYLYVASYAVHAASLYAGAKSERALLPSMVIVYMDYNLIALVLLVAICFALVNIYGATRQAVLYHVLICASHAMGIVVASLGETWLLAPIALRSVAPLALIPWRRGG
ncbi:hypothetical protein Pyrfu_1028 [Pyrolobus fumarii 1A]|uniref:Uncharacterized protein n=1 Tax=Pyrolobus fumarii (strain DSM 11204 / 1A) TaxID=694429 RepID=G0EES4_PYRF1|nr:hypothetical protein [Pyrolobus fumarii]AEM38896.1 hypothetical protein Pyrfu_1028 [Pyrolobus fumarii 1A]